MRWRFVTSNYSTLVSKRVLIVSLNIIFVYSFTRLHVLSFNLATEKYKYISLIQCHPNKNTRSRLLHCALAKLRRSVL